MNTPLSVTQTGNEVDNRLQKLAEPKPDRFQTWLIAVVGVVLAGLVFYSMSASSQYQQKTQADIAKISEQVSRLQDESRAGEAKFASLTQELADTRQALSDARQELGKLPRQIQLETQKAKLETQKAKVELSQAIAGKADSSQVEAVKQETVNKIEQVSTDVGGVRSEVGTVRTDLVSTKADLEGTKRQLIDVRDTLTEAIARNSSELAQLRRKGERNYFEFEIDKKSGWNMVEDIKLSLAKADPKNRKFNIRILVDDSQLEKKDRTINEPLQFLVGRTRLRYEVVINWVKKDKVGGYLSTPKDKVLSAEIAAAK